ncbi:MAG TPA: carbon monoxide dehydrogenase subunit G [Nocardioidaceae bacterium]|nr:carbon monoxide dehydrogenase subunit G [Nocardioidaceae bacterium]
MRISGEATINAPVEEVWNALLDPSVLVRTIPGCERLETTGENAYAMTVTAGVAAIKGTYAGTCELRDLHLHESLVLKAQGAGAPGTIGADVQVRFAGDGGTTTLTYDADAIVGGMIGGVGQRMLTSVSKRMAGEFFGNVEKAITAPEVAAYRGATGPAVVEDGAVFERAPSLPGGRADFERGMLVGAGLLALGLAVGVALGRRLAP